MLSESCISAVWLSYIIPNRSSVSLESQRKWEGGGESNDRWTTVQCSGWLRIWNTATGFVYAALYFPANIHSVTRVFHIAPLCEDSLSILHSGRECEWLPLEKSIGSMWTISPALNVWTGATQWSINGKQWETIRATGLGFLCNRFTLNYRLNLVSVVTSDRFGSSCSTWNSSERL